jgi:uncharacterized protein YukE
MKLTKAISTIATVAIMTSFAFGAVLVAIAVMDDNFAMKAFGQVIPSSPSASSAPQLTIPSQGPNPSPNQQAIIHACANTANTPGRPPFCPPTILTSSSSDPTSSSSTTASSLSSAASSLTSTQSSCVQSANSAFTSQILSAEQHITQSILTHNSALITQGGREINTAISSYNSALAACLASTAAS